MKLAGRRKPYNERGISRIKCSRCGDPAATQWQICGNFNRYLGICKECDVQLNALVLTFMRVPNSVELSQAYKHFMLADADQEKDPT